MAAAEAVLRSADGDDVAAVCAFGAAHLPAHYGPLIGIDAANGQVHSWWTPALMGAAVAAGLVVVAVEDGTVVGVGERGRWGDEHVIYKLYVHPGWRGRGLGPRLVGHLVSDLPEGVDHVLIEHFAANRRAGAFYEREGFAVDRVEPHPGVDRGLDAVWRRRPVQRAGSR